jgi:hypothetical protein
MRPNYWAWDPTPPELQVCGLFWAFMLAISGIYCPIHFTTHITHCTAHFTTHRGLRLGGRRLPHGAAQDHVSEALFPLRVPTILQVLEGQDGGPLPLPRAGPAAADSKTRQAARRHCRGAGLFKLHGGIST